MKMKLFALSVLVLTAGLKAQDSTLHAVVDPVAVGNPVTSLVGYSGFVPKWEVTSNVTLALSRFSGNVTRNLNDDPYLLMVRRITYNESGKQAAWRMGVNGFRRKTEDMTGGFSEVTRSSEENWASLALGREWRRQLGHGFYTSAGLR